MQQWLHPAFLKLRNARPRDDGLVRTCNLSLLYADFQQVGGFDESFSGWGLEDTELAVRLIARGVRVRSGRFATNVFHMWHTERSRADVDGNARRLDTSRKKHATSTLSG
jgi:predicted glycosyltransferase involved in capsule biosynthesis